MSFTATLNPTMPQGLSSYSAATRPASSISFEKPFVLTKALIAQWVASRRHIPSPDLQNFLSSQSPDFKLDASATPLAEPRKRTRRIVDHDDAPARVPRPPNAFMIFRSDLIKDTKFALQKIQKKQQHLSVIAGEIWNIMPEECKTVWRTKAMSRLREHQEKHPQYKYTPKQRNGRGKKASKESSPSSADLVAGEQWRGENFSEFYHGTAPPPAHRRRGAQPYEVPTSASQQHQAGPSGASEEARWHRLRIPPRSASHPADPPTTALPDHLTNIYSCPPTTLPPSAHSSPGSCHSEPAYFPAAHDLPSDFHTTQHTAQPPMAALDVPVASSSVLEPPLLPNHLPPPDVPAEMWVPDLSLSAPEDPTNMRGNFDYGFENFWSVQHTTNGKPEADIFSLAGTQQPLWPSFDLSTDVQNMFSQHPVLSEVERDALVQATMMGLELPIFGPPRL
ncbi:unnamed protein product [Peniophora sp. CBMAI 1063]|nr:unnamed protein product [Peniophora sp. CBMAI 1063]